ncbi:MAG: rod shape-determining protein RodA [Bdellovibrionales bacterium]|nr:rod shape-determining protein RodA [Bdellovibrionales bacterium]
MSHSLNLKIEERTPLKRLDWNYIIVILTLQVIGLVNLYSAAFSTSHLSRVFSAQTLWIPIGWSAFFLIARLNYKRILNLSFFIYLANLIALILVLLIGKQFYGARRWLDLAVFHYQPSETMKLSLILFLGAYLAKHKSENLGFKELLVPGLIIGLPFLLTAKQPDLGTAMLLAAIPSSMLLFLKVKTRVLVSALLVAAVSLPLAWNYGLKPYQKNRVLNFLNPERDPRGTGYNSIQAKIAIGSGQILGKGFRQGSQSQLEFLPERHSDFIFCVLSEEYGFIGGLFTLSLFTILLFLILHTAANSNDRSGALICVGVAAFIFWHMLINVGMVTGLLPIVGVPLPLLSYGGSSMVTFMVSLGLVASVSNQRYMF